ncbi:MAG: hypothetical protein NZV14_11615 [Bryobacteraceae bacterium]|nr:hypothetical protein [Bryobacteraceae bacterium]MDW8378801.1 hypothetical protein [Bryobacterales bacterium]
MKLFSLFFCFALLAFSQEATAIFAPLGIPCDPAGPSPLGPGFPFLCPPEEEQGILVFLRTDNPGAAGYRTTVRYTTAGGEQKEAVQSVAKRESGIWTVDVFRIGRLRTATLSGITVDSVQAQVLTSLEQLTIPATLTATEKRKPLKASE